MPSIDSTADHRIEKLLDRWDELRAQGGSPAPGELTTDPELVPELERAIAEIMRVEQGLGGASRPAAVQARGVPGRFEALQKHDEGGMGVVYRAHDAELGRAVAYKVIKRELSSDQRAVARFLNEAKVTAGIQHPGVVPVHALTSDDDGRPAYAMRFVEGGVPLLQAVEQFHAALSRAPTTRAGWQGLLNHFVRICQTIGHAHSLGVLHRDISPRNILLVGDAETLVIDWGLARAVRRQSQDTGTDDASADEPTRAGTAAYTAPEIWEPALSLGPQSDIYALGALLYLILSGRAPYAGKNSLEVIAKLRDGPPPEVSAVRPGVPRPLAKICAKAMSRKPSERYATALELAADVNSWLAGERVKADREPWRETAWRWAGRHRTSMGIAATLLLAGATVGPLAFVRERQLRGKAESESIRANRERQLALKALDEIITQAETIGSLQASIPAAKAVLDRGVRHLEERARDAQADPARRAHVADLYSRAGRIRFTLSQLPEAEDAFAKATSLMRELVREQPANHSSRQVLASYLRDWGVSLAVQGKAQHAVPLWQQARELLEPIAGSDPACQHTLAKLYMAMGNLPMFSGKYKEAEETFERGRVLASQLVAARPSDASYQFTLADILNNQGMLFMAEAVAKDGKLADPVALKKSQAAHRQALELRRQLVQAEPGNPRCVPYLAASFNNLGDTFQMQGESGFSESEANYREALTLLEPLAFAFPGTSGHQRDIAQIFSNLNGLLTKEKRWAEAEAMARRAIDDFRRLAKTYPKDPDLASDLGVTLEQLANTSRLQAKKAEANDGDFAAALAFGRAAALVDDPARRASLASNALGALQRLRGEGFFADPRNVERLQKEPDLESARAGPDYAKLLKALGRK
jgi:tetratricopeptide (TPR) repeat protein